MTARLLSLAGAGALALGVLGGLSPAQADTDAGYLIGTVTDAAGKPIAGAGIETFWCDTVDDGGPVDADGCYNTPNQSFGTSDRNGRYVVTISNNAIANRTGETGSWRAKANRTAYTGSASVTFTPAARANTTGPTFALAPEAPVAAPPNTALTGLVTDSAGAPIAGAFVSAYDATGRQVDGTSTGSDGRYYFDVSDPAADPTPADYARTNVTGAIRVFAEAPGRVDEWTGGTPAKSRATSTTVPAYPATTAATAPTIALDAVGSVTGTITLPAANGNWGAGVTLYDLDGNDVAGAGTDSTGAFSVDVEPGTYVVRADGYRYTEASSNDAGCTACTDVLDTYAFVAGYYGGGSSQATAKKITVKSGAAFSTGTISLTNALKVVEKPTVKGKLKKGGLVRNSKLKVSTGTWNTQVDVDYGFVWKVGSKTLSTSDTLKVTKKVQKKIGKKLNKLTVTVTATDTFGELVDGKVKVKVKKALAQDDKGSKGSKGSKGGKGKK